MPLYKTITVNTSTKVLIWNIEESFETLLDGVVLTPQCQDRVAGMKSDIHRRGFLSVRHLLQKFGYTAHDLFYDANGKPHLKDGNYISITHSFEYAAVIVSTSHDVGIDIEMKRAKIIRIAPKFTTLKDYAHLTNEEQLVEKLTKVWCAKESLYKIYATPGLSFLQHINVFNFKEDALATSGEINYNHTQTLYDIAFLEFGGFMCAYAYPKI
ncbi:4'-phosphopantetheinyl transferase family protein [Neptunitalea lumnitzerae]|uniref:4'-phosphopantetheinyl transferase n=1 Tax=Neptunitalea lumnitzerae TaxID=2965509 RepID=A0ABQ5MG78_9FLAO|nr:4'-phosphopantetheinyl transferase superfamily protein [Neptunitalea sp. Y10]GLB48426.1 4'-phosphopantetheinyl transferase [Neptunitalea sp. Y10]